MVKSNLLGFCFASLTASLLISEFNGWLPPFRLPKSPLHSEKLLQKAKSLGSSTVTIIPPEQYERWIEHQTHIAFERIINNIGGYGQDLKDVMRGAVIASPSKSHPDYYYQWTRDSGITINTLIMNYADNNATNATLRNIIYDYINSSRIIQRVSNPSGTFDNLEGLGEPKFKVDGRPFTAAWGRPQRDGPALRAIAMLNFVNTEIKYNESGITYENFRDIFDNVIRPDLDYVGLKWQYDGFDLWEELKGKHFFTSMCHRRALISGSDLAQKLGYADAAIFYQTQASYLTQFIRDYFYDHKNGHLVETFGNYKRSGLDSALFLGSIHALDLLLWSGKADVTDIYPPYSDEVLASLVQYITDMKYRYPINFSRLKLFDSLGVNTSLVGIGVGRYPEDIYNGVNESDGNPWFLCTATVSHTLYLLADYLYTRTNDFTLKLTEHTIPLLGMFLDKVEGFDWSNPSFELKRSSSDFDLVVLRILAYGDSFLDVIREHVDSNGSMSEQFSRYDGYMRGAENLTWSYGAFWSAVRQRKLVYGRIK
jgi:glucoamylase